jgi:hypothetical protein
MNQILIYYRRSQIFELCNVVTLSGSLVSTAWRVLRLWMETVYRYSRGLTTRGVPRAWGIRVIT